MLVRFLCVASILLAACGEEDSSQPVGPVSGPGTGGAGGGGGSGATGGGGAAAAGGGGSGALGGGGSGAGFPGNYDCTPPDGVPPALKLTELSAGFDAPLLVKSAPGDPRLYVVEQNGRIRILDGATTLAPPFLYIVDRITAVAEQGLLGLAFHPGYEENGRFFVHYSGPLDGETVIAEYARSADPNLADPTPVAIVLTIPQPGDNHNGGSIEFGADGMLYIALGDGGGSGNPYMTSQDPSSLLGKILRIDVSTTPYSIPPGNMPGGAPEIWDMGVRNPFRLSFDPCTGDMYFGDVGEKLWEEIDVEAAGTGSVNYGWSIMEGTHCFGAASCDQTGLTLPTVEYDHLDGRCAVMGGYVYRSGAIPALRGSYFYGDFCGEQIRSFVWSGGQATAETDWTADLTKTGYGIRSFGYDDAGNVLLVAGATIYRIDPE